MYSKMSKITVPESDLILIKKYYKEDNKKVSVMEKPDSCKRHNHVVFIAGFNDIIITD